MESEGVQATWGGPGSLRPSGWCRLGLCVRLDVWDPMRLREVWGLHSHEASGSHL